MAAYAEGNFDATLAWAALVVDTTTMRATAAQTTMTIAGVVTETWSGNKLPGFAAAGDCEGAYSTLGEIVIDLIGTPFRVDGPSTCAVQQAGGGPVTCSQWVAVGSKARITVACSNNNQRCVVRCGGDAGRCLLTEAYLQLAVHDANQLEDSRVVPASSTDMLDIVHVTAPLDRQATAGPQQAAYIIGLTSSTANIVQVRALLRCAALRCQGQRGGSCKHGVSLGVERGWVCQFHDTTRWACAAAPAGGRSRQPRPVYEGPAVQRQRAWAVGRRRLWRRMVRTAPALRRSGVRH